MKTNAKVPELRFLEFSGDWDEKKLKKLTDVLRCGIASTPIYVDEGVIFLSSQNVTKDGNISIHKYNFISQEFYEKISKNNKLLKGDILYSRVGASYGNAAIFPFSGDFGVYVSLTHIRASKQLNNTFLKYILNSSIGKNQARKGVFQGGGVPNLNVKVVEKFNIPLPTIPEQTKIAQFLATVDDKIAQLTKKKTLLEQYKKGVSQKLFNQKIRFKDDKGHQYTDWVERKLGDVGKFKGGGTPSKKIKEYWDGDIPWISSSDVNEENIHKINISRFINEQSIKNSATKIIPKNSILFISRVGVGKLAINKKKLCTSQDFTNFIPTKTNSYYLGYYFQAKKNVLKSFNQGTSIKGFTKKDISSLKLKIPFLPEQQKIANILSSIDTKIDQASQQLDQTKQFKKALLQQMFV